MIFRPPIKHKNIIEKTICVPRTELTKDNEKIEKIKSLCKELGLCVHEIEDARESITYLRITIKYKEVLL